MSLRDRLRGRSLPTETVRLPQDPAASARAERVLAAAAWALEEARASGGRDTAALRAKVTAARERLDGLPCLEVTVRALPPPEWEALVELHPATEDQQAKGLAWNPSTFRHALLEACVVPEEGAVSLSAEEWAQAAKESLTTGEFAALCNAAIGLNLRSPAPSVGKES